MSKALDSAVKAFQLYAGSMGLPIKTQQKFYSRMMRKAETTARQRGVSTEFAYEELSREATRRGAVIPIPGKDY